MAIDPGALVPFDFELLQRGYRADACFIP